MPLDPNTLINFAEVHVAVVDGNIHGQDILAQIFTGFGVRHVHRCGSGGEAMGLLSKTPMALVVIETVLPDMEGHELVHWIRRGGAPNDTASVVLTSGHTPMRRVVQARDCGASVIVAKPIRTQVVLDRVTWLARDQRDFVNAPRYVGPDRRWRNLGPPQGKPRRSTDLTAKLGVAIDPNLDQADIDALFKPTRMIL